MAGTDPTGDRLTAALQPSLSGLGYDVEAVELSAAGKRRVLRVAVDRDGGVTLDDVAAATSEVARVLDETDLLGQRPYTLEVTSRGVDRPLTLPRHWRRNVDRLVALTLTDDATLTGRIVAVSEEPGAESATLDVDGEERLVPLAEVARALVQIEFNRPAQSEPTRKEV